MTTHRWIGYIGRIDAIGKGDLVLTQGDPAGLVRFLRLDLPRFPIGDSPGTVRCDRLPLPLLTASGERIGDIDTVGLTHMNRIVAAGTISVDAGTPWGAALLRGDGQSVVLNHDQGEVTELRTRRRSLADLWRPTTRTFRVVTGWRVTGASIDPDDAPRRLTGNYIRLSAGAGGPGTA